MRLIYTAIRRCLLRPWLDLSAGNCVRSSQVVSSSSTRDKGSSGVVSYNSRSEEKKIQSVVFTDTCVVVVLERLRALFSSSSSSFSPFWKQPVHSTWLD